MYRDTYVEINLGNIESNVCEIIKKYNNYKYYFGVVKADCYGHGDIKTVGAIIKGGANYLAVATLDEAVRIRKVYKNIPILCLGIVYNKYLYVAKKYNITLSITGLEYLNSLNIEKLKGLKVHIKVNTGMNRLGVSSKKEFNRVFDLLNKNNIEIEGIYSHVYNSNSSKKTNEQFSMFENITSDIDLSKIKIIHIPASSAIVRYKKKEYVNGCRLGIIMYGFSDNNDLNLKSTFKVYSRVIQINNLRKGDTLGYDGAYTANKDEKIAVVAIGYADGIVRKNKGRDVYINDKKYKIVGNICMDMLFVSVDDSVKLFDTVEVIKDVRHIKEISSHVDSIPYEVMCEIGKRVNRKYIN
ncbi:alanine racemase [Clostridium sp. CAG:1219]|nr:alanine racemase [Clostridium sp. CAG:1219]